MSWPGWSPLVQCVFCRRIVRRSKLDAYSFCPECNENRARLEEAGWCFTVPQP